MESMENEDAKKIMSDQKKVLRWPLSSQTCPIAIQQGAKGSKAIAEKMSRKLGPEELTTSVDAHDDTKMPWMMDSRKKGRIRLRQAKNAKESA
jgi:hypothetical protein